MLPLLALVSLAFSEPLAITTEQLDESSFLLSMPSAAAAGALAVQLRLEPAAKKACSDKRSILGRYRFVTETGFTRFEQELLCIAAGHRLKEAAGAALEPSRADQQAVLAASYAYWAAKDRGDYAGAYRTLSERVRANVLLDGWSETSRAFYAEAGAPLGRRVVEITWYDDPADAPEPGRYVAADYSADFDKVEFVCGYLMWRVQADGTLRLVREEQNIAPRRSSGRPLAAIDRDPLRARMGCKD